MNYLRFLLAVWMAWAVVLSSMAQGAELPSERQCQTRIDQTRIDQTRIARKSTIKPEMPGWCLIIMRDKGNCLACHDVGVKFAPDGLATAGNIAPVLANIASRFENKIALKNILYNAAAKNRQTIMPLFGKHKILTEPEIDQIVAFLMTL